jgi:hypothetical protein
MSWDFGNSNLWLGQGGGTGGIAAPLVGLGGSFLNYKQQKDAQKDRLKMFDKQYKYQQNQDAIARADYLKKQKAEEDAWANFGQSGDPYSSDPYSNTVANTNNYVV